MPKNQVWPSTSHGFHSGGYGNPIHGWLEGEPVTVAFGWGEYEGHVLLAEGHVHMGTFKQRGNHTNYGPNHETYGNVKERLTYIKPAG